MMEAPGIGHGKQVDMPLLDDLPKPALLAVIDDSDAER